MSLSDPKQLQKRATVASFVSLALISLGASSQIARADDDQKAGHKRQTETPIEHVIVLIGENRTFDHLFATYVPKSGDSVSNLLSKKIINADGSPGRNFAQAAQFQAVPPFRNKYFISLGKSERNWRLKPLTDRSRDNFPNPVSDRENPYVPLNSPAIGDLFDMFRFDRDGDDR